jgi:hypothetical protein
MLCGHYRIRCSLRHTLFPQGTAGLPLVSRCQLVTISTFAGQAHSNSVAIPIQARSDYGLVDRPSSASDGATPPPADMYDMVSSPTARRMQPAPMHRPHNQYTSTIFVITDT